MGGIKIFSVDGAKINNVVISDIKMDSVSVPIMARLGARLLVFRKNSTQKQPIGSIQNIIFRNIVANTIVKNHERIPAVGILISGIEGDKLVGITLENVTINMPGGETIKENTAQIEEFRESYPELFMFGNNLPAYGLWGRHINELTLKNVTFNLGENDFRPAVFLEDTRGIKMENVSTNLKTGFCYQIK